RVLASRAGRAQLLRPRRRQHAPSGGSRRAAPERRVAAADGGRADRSCFMMTEPAPGAGADPSMLLTTARRDGDAFVIDGRKWLITGAVGANLGIVMARNDSDTGGPAGATMFLTSMSAPGIHIERVLDTLDQYMTGGHAVVRLDGLRVPETAVLGRVGEGFRYAQARLAPARLTHCMRWLGAARRAHDIATD